ncbi:MAG: long-chain fatty acid--CoA ligase [Betaproteobacteria bacterium]|nr:MAG: long-chain fatty acid--CoA ligase [Betaproteobacteria bacterium]
MSDTLRGVLARHVARQPDRTLLVAPETGRTLSYRELDRQARLLARWLRLAGLEPGDKVGLYLHNGYQTALLFLGAMLGGYVITPLNLLAQRSQLAYVLAHCDCKVLFTSREHEAMLAEALALVARRIEVIVIDPDAPALFLEDRLPQGGFGPVAADDPALLMYTSGTTGTPKGAVLTHRNLIAAGRAVAAWHGLTPQDRCLSSLPLYHINGQVIATVTPFVSGGSLIAPHRFSVTHWWDQVERHAATWINMVPTIIAYLLNAADARRSYRFPRVRFGRSASAPLPPEQHRAFETTFGIPVIEAMGMTESSSVVFCNPQDAALRKYGSPGVPCGVEAKVVDLETGRALPAGVRGEICLRGPNVMRTYYKSPEQTAKALDAKGWLRTGDLGYRDADGYYFVTGRLKELIIKGGENIAPREIDEALLRHPAVLEAAAVGIADANYGQEILACIVLKPGARASEAEIREFCLAQLGRYKSPREIRFLAELPKGPSGKVQRLKLAALAQ